MGRCQHQVIDQSIGENLFLCLVYKEFFRSCPPKCPYHKAGSPLSFNRLYYDNYDIECTYFHTLVQCSTYDTRSFICELMVNSADCSNCPLKASSNPGTNFSQSC